MLMLSLRFYFRPTLIGAALLMVLVTALRAATPDRPNILWITCEDSSPHLGAYGDTFAVTPTLDALARESVRYTQAFAYTGVCAPSRSCLITGVYPLRLGSHRMRSTTQLPDTVKCFPEYLRNAGYYASNNVKEDYNFVTPKTAWDESSNRAHWRQRQPGQPFFSVFNFTVTHQSQIFCDDVRYRENTKRLTPAQRRDPAKVTVPPFHPDTPEFRREWARHYENVTAMDYQVADLLAELEKDGLAEDTIVFFFSDHGTGMPGVKMFAWGPSLQVPLLVRFPKKWQHLAPTAPGGTTDRLVTFVDFAPTVLSLAGVSLPRHFQGSAFLGAKAAPARTHIFGGKDRQGECYDTIRYVRDERFQYLRNFQPHLPYGQFMSYVWQHESMQAWERLHQTGKLTGTPARFFAARKPGEELYDVRKDPWQVNNLATDPAYANDVARYRALLLQEMRTAGDLGLLPEREMHARMGSSTPYVMATDARLNPLDALLRAADLASQRDGRQLHALTELLRAGDSAVRWWGAVGLLALGSEAAPAKTALVAALEDASPDVRITAAETLAQLGALDRALPAIRQAQLVVPGHKDASDYVGRMVEYLPEKIGQ